MTVLLKVWDEADGLVYGGAKVEVSDTDEVALHIRTDEDGDAQGSAYMDGGAAFKLACELIEAAAGTHPADMPIHDLVKVLRRR
jgi:hypothetical protein